MRMQWPKPRNVLIIPPLYHEMSNDQFAGQHTVRGVTKEKSKKLDELKARRKAKDEKKRVSMDNTKTDFISHGF